MRVKFLTIVIFATGSNRKIRNGYVTLAYSSQAGAKMVGAKFLCKKFDLTINEPIPTYNLHHL